MKADFINKDIRDCKETELQFTNILHCLHNRPVFILREFLTAIQTEDFNILDDKTICKGYKIYTEEICEKLREAIEKLSNESWLLFDKLLPVYNSKSALLKKNIKSRKSTKCK